MKLNVPDSIMSIKPYVPGKPIEELEREYGLARSVKLASNENPLGPSPKAIEAVQKALSKTNRYPDGGWYLLRKKLADRYAVPMETIIIGNGSDDIIALLAHAFLKPGTEALIPFPSFLMYEISIKASGADVVRIPLDGYAIDLERMAGSCTEKTRMIFLTNPNNPTGSCFSSDEFDTFLRSIPGDVLVVVDEAYIEFVRQENAYNAMKNPLSDPRIICLRTFSKAYGLAGFRVGYGVMDREIADVLHRIRQPFNVNSLAQVAAEAAIDDREFLEKSLAVAHRGIDSLSQALSEMGLYPVPTQANFFLVDVRTDANRVFQEMLKLGVIVRSMASYGYGTYIRVNAGLDEENALFIDSLKRVL